MGRGQWNSQGLLGSDPVLGAPPAPQLTTQPNSVLIAIMALILFHHFLAPKSCSTRTPRGTQTAVPLIT